MALNRGAFLIKMHWFFETRGLNAYAIRSEKSYHSITLSHKDMPYVGIWSPYPKEAPFVCIEPWCGIADTVNSSGNLMEKSRNQSTRCP